MSNLHDRRLTRLPRKTPKSSRWGEARMPFLKGPSKPIGCGNVVAIPYQGNPRDRGSSSSRNRQRLTSL